MKADLQADRSGKLTQRVMNKIKERFFLRFHMSLILLATVLSGLLATKLLLLAQVHNIVIRYPLAVVFAYLAFFLFVKLWLLYMSASHPLRKSDSSGDILSGLPDPVGRRLVVGQRTFLQRGRGRDRGRDRGRRRRHGRF